MADHVSSFHENWNCTSDTVIGDDASLATRPWQLRDGNWRWSAQVVSVQRPPLIHTRPAKGAFTHSRCMLDFYARLRYYLPTTTHFFPLSICGGQKIVRPWYLHLIYNSYPHVKVNMGITSPFCRKHLLVRLRILYALPAYGNFQISRITESHPLCSKEMYV